LTTSIAKVVSAQDAPSNRRRGGLVTTVLSPATVNATSGFMGTVRLEPGEVVTEHFHPYSEEFLYLVEGEIAVRLDGDETTLRAGSGLFIPKNVKHRLYNHREVAAFGVFQLSPLAPRPDLGHVDTETLTT
jgi:putative monooxygenase